MLDAGGVGSPAERIVTLQPNVGVNGIRSDISPDLVGKIVIQRSELLEDGRNTWSPSTFHTLAIPPSVNDPYFSDWIYVVHDYNIVLSTNMELIGKFASEYKDGHAYAMETDIGTRFKNSANFGVINCTGMTLYGVDDVGSEGTAKGTMHPIPAGEDIPLPLWTQQEANNKYNIRPGTRYIRSYRHSMYHEGVGKFRGVMREWVHVWDKQTAPTGYLYIPSHQIILFDNQESAIAFIDEFHSVQNYQRHLYNAEIETLITDTVKRENEKLTRKQNIMFSACGIFVSIVVASNGFSFLWDILSKHKSKNNMRKGQSGFTKTGFNCIRMRI
jgi:hypothetical protein